MGRFGDVVDFASLPENVRTSTMASQFGANVTYTSSGLGFQACGSRGEVANNQTLGHRFFSRQWEDDAYYQGIDQPQDGDNAGKALAFTSVVLQAPDQLRQRVAWALSQIFTASTPFAVWGVGCFM